MSERLSTLKTILTSPQHSRLGLARSKTSFSPEQLLDILFGEGNFNNHVKPYITLIENNRDIFTHHHLEHHSYTEQRKEAARMLMALRRQIKLDLAKQPEKLMFVNYAINMYDHGICVKTLLHYFLYTKSILLYQSNPKHQQLYQRAITGEDIGCFALTEFHHGSYSKGIQTLAVYDRQKEEFVLTTQGTKGMKFWIGGLSEVANVTVVWAQLIIDGKSEGPHPFYLPIRSQKTHKVLPGITIGDCGPKKGNNYIDNGYLILDDVRIPRENLLGRFGSVDEQGSYQSPIKDWNARFGLHMSALSAGRGLLAMTTSALALNALTIALRYSHSRKQFETADKADQIAIIDYPLTQIRLIPEIATQIVQIPAGTKIASIYSSDKQLFRDNSYVNEMHALSAAVKVRYSWSSLKSSRQCRTVLGGHGYSQYSRIPNIINNVDVNTTWEGDNHVLLQQASKFVIKTITKKRKTKVVSLDFVHDTPNIDHETLAEQLEDLKNYQIFIQDLLRKRYLVAKQKMEQLKTSYNDQEEVEGQFHPQTGNALALAYADYFTFVTVRAKVAEAKGEAAGFLGDCLRLWAATLLERERYGPHEFRLQLQKQISALSTALVSGCVVATDGLTPSAFVLGSPFADPNGQGFRDYINMLFTKPGSFQRASYKDDIRKMLAH